MTMLMGFVDFWLLCTGAERDIQRCAGGQALLGACDCVLRAVQADHAVPVHIRQGRVCGPGVAPRHPRL
jgi:hypothetical protein